MKNKFQRILIIAFVFLSSINVNAQLWMQWDTSNISNIDDAIHALAETQRVLGWDHVHGRVDWVYGDIMSDDSEKGGEGASDQPEMRELEIYTHSSGSAIIATTWNELYTGVFRANHIIYSLENKVADTPWFIQDSARIKAEARFLRAYFYFRLNMLFSGVPLITEPVAINKRSECTTPRSTAQQIWAFIENELQLAIPNLPLKGLEYVNANALCNNAYMKSTGVYLITKGAAQALLCKAHIFDKKWAGARSLAEDIINSGDYKLCELNSNFSFDQIFDLEHENSEESIFEIQQFADPNPDYNYGWGNGDMGTLMNVYILSRNHGGWGFNCPTQNLFAEFETGDVRRKYTIAKHGDNLLYGIKAYNTKNSPTGFLSRKYIVPADTIAKASALSNGPSNIRIIRYADVLLWHAEACAQLGDSVAADSSLMQVRKRAGMLTMASSKYGQSLLEKIYHERRVELAMEGHRFFDLTRTGRAAAVLGSSGFVSGKHEYLPIPKSVVDESNGVILQNPGY